MADEVLTRAELEALLGNLDAGLAPKLRSSAHHGVPAPHLRLGPSSAAERPRSSRSRRGKLPERLDGRLDEEPLARLRALHEAFARQTCVALSSMLHGVIEVKLAWIEQVTFGELVERLPNPTCACVVRAAPLAPNWLLNFETPVLYAMIDRMFGGNGGECAVPRRPLTEIEIRLASRVARLLVDELKKVWQPVIAFDPAIERVESNPRLVLSAGSEEATVLIGFEATLDDTRGIVTLGIPTASISSAFASTGSGLANGTPTTDTRIVRGGNQQDPQAVEVVVRLAETTITADELRQLRVGDIIATEADVQALLPVSLAGVARFRARPGTLERRKAVRIVEKAAPQADTRDLKTA